MRSSEFSDVLISLFGEDVEHVLSIVLWNKIVSLSILKFHQQRCISQNWCLLKKNTITAGQASVSKERYRIIIKILSYNYVK